MEMLDKKDISNAVMARFCANCSLEDNCDKTCHIYAVLHLIDKHAFFIPSCEECEFSEEIGILPEDYCYCYCNCLDIAVRKDGFCSKGRKKDVRH